MSSRSTSLFKEMCIWRFHYAEPGRQASAHGDGASEMMPASAERERERRSENFGRRVLLGSSRLKDRIYGDIMCGMSCSKVTPSTLFGEQF